MKLSENWVGVTGLQEGISRVDLFAGVGLSSGLFSENKSEHLQKGIPVAKEKEYPSGDALIYSL